MAKRQLIAVSMMLIPIAAFSQTSTSSFEKILNYSRSFAALEEKHRLLLDAKPLLFKEENEIRRSLAESEVDIQKVAARSIITQIQQLESNMAYQISLYNANMYAEYANRSHVNDPAARRALRSVLIDNSIENLRLNGQLQQLDSASKLTIERRFKLLNQYEQLLQKYKQWIDADFALIDQYLALSDIAGAHSQLYLNVAMRELEKSRPDNSGAFLARVITQIRQGDFSSADKELSQLNMAQSLPRIKNLTRAIRVELRLRQGDNDIQQELNLLTQPTNQEPAIYWLVAQCWNVLGDHKQALNTWERLLKTGKYDIAAHRGISLTCLSGWSGKKQYQRKALDHAKLASSLSVELDWSCQIALALATAANGDFTTAATIAEAAAALADGDQSELCVEVAEELKLNQLREWSF